MKRNARNKNRRPQTSKVKAERQSKPAKRNPKRRNHEES
jgi:hypothetical protein